MGTERKCFVIMSFDSKYDVVYSVSIKKAIEDEGLKAIRVDDDSVPNNVPHQIVNEIIESDLVIADLTDPRPNIFYELGISHSIGNKTIIISQNADSLPFDIRNEYTIIYNNNRDGLKLLYYELRRLVKIMIDRPDTPSNIVQIAGQSFFDLKSSIRQNLANLIQERERVVIFQQFLNNNRTTNNNESVIQNAKKIANLYKEKGGQCFIAVSGAAGLGKTLFSKSLVQALVKEKITCSVLPVDSFMMDRASRLEQNLSGYDPRAFDLDSLKQAISSLKSGKSVEYREYDHKIGEHGIETKLCTASDVVVVDGVQSCHPILIPTLDYKIFLHAEKQVAKELRFLTDLFDRSYSVQKAFSHVDGEYEMFLEHVFEQAKFADRVIHVQPYWEHELE